MRRLLIPLLLAVLLCLAAAPQVRAMMTKEEADKQGIVPGQNTSPQKPAKRPAGIIRTEDGKVFVVPGTEDKHDTGKDANTKKQ